MRSYKIIACDLDGTLLNDKAEISSQNLRAIEELLKRGVYFVPSSGRTLSEIPWQIKDNPAIRYIIYSNGAVVADRHTDKRISYCIPNGTGREILDVLNSFETHITFRRDGESFVDAAFQSDEAYEYYNVCIPHRVVVRSFAVYCENFRDISYSSDNVEVFSAFFRNYDDKITCKKIIEKNKNLRAVEVSEHNIEIVNVNAGKGNALYALADMIGVDYADTLSMGDSENDSSIIRAAGLGLAVSNACDSLKAVADEVICSNEEHAVEYVLSHYF